MDPSRVMALTPPERAAGRGRDDGCPPPPAQSRAGATNAHGSYLGFGHIWRRNAPRDTVAVFGLAVASCPGLPESGPSLGGCVGFSAGAFETTCAARHCGTPSAGPICPESRDIGSTPSPLARATPRSPSAMYAFPVAVGPAIL